MSEDNTSPPSGRPERLGRDVIYESEWVNLFADRVRLPAGRIIERFHVLDYEKQAVAAVVENSRGDILMVECHRYVFDSVAWEIPAGMIDDGEDILPAAQREVLEETGYQTRRPRHLYSFHPENGMSNRTFHVAHCVVDEECPPVEFDGNEILAVHWKSVDEVKSMIRDRRITDGFSLTGLLVFLLD